MAGEIIHKNFLMVMRRGPGLCNVIQVRAQRSKEGGQIKSQYTKTQSSHTGQETKTSGKGVRIRGGGGECSVLNEQMILSVHL